MIEGTEGRWRERVYEKEKSGKANAGESEERGKNGIRDGSFHAYAGLE
jgi:hypothetical protein